MLKLFKIFLITLALCTVTVEARTLLSPINSAIKQSEINDSALISVSFKELKTGKTIYKMNEEKPMNPASVQKIVTYLPSVDVLKKDYEFKTQLYKDKSGNLYLKLGADPYLTTRELKYLLLELRTKNVAVPKEFFIDDSILDEFEWGEGWQWDDDMNPRMQKFSAYNIDKNLLTVNVTPTNPGAPADISLNIFYPTSFMNNILTGNKTSITLARKNYISPDVINADGTVSVDTEIQIPVNHPRRYFIFRVEECLRSQKFLYYGNFKRAKTPKDAILIGEVKHSLGLATEDILKRSDNMVAETVFKLAGGKYAQGTGTTESAIEMFHQYYQNLGISTDHIKIVDGSGVSKNNLVTADFISEVLKKEAAKEDFDITIFASPNEGTLKDRMLYFKDKLHAKTGTLTSTSSIAGYLTGKSGKTYAFCIMINDANSKSSDMKSFEEYLLRKAYDSL